MESWVCCAFHEIIYLQIFQEDEGFEANIWTINDKQRDLGVLWENFYHIMILDV